jgi:hypothetical protein
MLLLNAATSAMRLAFPPQASRLQQNDRCENTLHTQVLAVELLENCNAFQPGRVQFRAAHCALNLTSSKRPSGDASCEVMGFSHVATVPHVSFTHVSTTGCIIVVAQQENVQIFTHL